MATIEVNEEWKLLINGEWVTPTNGTYEVVNPNTTQIVGYAPEASVQQTQDAIEGATQALPKWRATSPANRTALLSKLADILEQRVQEWIPLVQAETGATINTTESMQIGDSFLNRFRYYSRPFELDTPLLPFTSPSNALGTANLVSAVVHRQPVGVVACITPYNFPLINVAGKIAPALAMGNTCIIKPAPQDPLAILRLGEAIQEAGFPPGVVQILTASGPEVPATLVASKQVNMISFTGSTAIGSQIYQAGAPNMTRQLMELGGKGALIMTKDADINTAVSAISTVWGFHSGQVCTAPTRVICHRSLYDQTVDKLAEMSSMLKIGDALSRDTIVGPLISKAHRDRVEQFIQSGVDDDGATLVCGGQRPDLPGYFIAPTLLADCTANMHVVREEAFGPVIVAMPYDNDEEAISLANDSDYGLFSYVFAGDTPRAYEIGRQLQSGNVALNSVQPHMEAPFGGCKMSGIGRDRGQWGLEAYSEVQAINWAG